MPCTNGQNVDKILHFWAQKLTADGSIVPYPFLLLLSDDMLLVKMEEKNVILWGNWIFGRSSCAYFYGAAPPRKVTSRRIMITFLTKLDKFQKRRVIFVGICKERSYLLWFSGIFLSKCRCHGPHGSEEKGRIRFDGKLLLFTTPTYRKQNYLHRSCRRGRDFLKCAKITRKLYIFGKIFENLSFEKKLGFGKNCDWKVKTSKNKECTIIHLEVCIKKQMRKRYLGKWEIAPPCIMWQIDDIGIFNFNSNSRINFYFWKHELWIWINSFFWMNLNYELLLP